MKYKTLLQKLINENNNIIVYSDILDKRKSIRDVFIKYNDYSPYNVIKQSPPEKDLQEMLKNHCYYYSSYSDHNLSKLHVFIKKCIDDYMSKMSSIEYWNYSLYFNLVMVVTESKPENKKYFYKQGKGKISDYVYDFFYNKEGRLNYIIFPFRVSTHYEMAKDLSVRDTVANRGFDMNYDLLDDLLLFENGLIEEYEDIVNSFKNEDDENISVPNIRKNTKNTIMDEIHVLPMFNISIANMTNDFYSIDYDIIERSNGKPRRKLYIPSDIASIYGGFNNKNYNKSQETKSSKNEDYFNMLNNGIFKDENIIKIKKRIKNSSSEIPIDFPKSLSISFGEYNNKKDTSMLILSFDEIDAIQYDNNSYKVSINKKGYTRIINKVATLISSEIDYKGNKYRVVENKNKEPENVLLLNSYIIKD